MNDIERYIIQRTSFMENMQNILLPVPTESIDYFVLNRVSIRNILNNSNKILIDHNELQKIEDKICKDIENGVINDLKNIKI